MQRSLTAMVEIGRFDYAVQISTAARGFNDKQLTALYGSRIQILRSAIRAGAIKLAFDDKVELALTTATTTNHGTFTLRPGEEKVWRLSNVDNESEFQVDFTQDGASYSTPVLHLR